MTHPLVWDDRGNGLLKGVEYRASPNCDERPANATVDTVILHFISVPERCFGGRGIVDLFSNTLDCTRPETAHLAGLRVSAHFLITRDGGLIQFVPCGLRAWHAGVSRWRGRPRCNDFSVGVEIEGCADLSFENAQYETLERVLAALRARYPVSAVVGHEHVAPGRKNDPGPCFDWSRVG